MRARSDESTLSSVMGSVTHTLPRTETGDTQSIEHHPLSLPGRSELVFTPTPVDYFVTGGTGFIGRFLVERLLARGGRVHLLVRKSSAEKLAGLRDRVGGTEANVLPVWGDLTARGLTDAETRRALAGRIDHVFHLAAVYDMGMDDETADRVNNEGTRDVVSFANELGRDVRLHHVSS